MKIKKAAALLLSTVLLLSLTGCNKLQSVSGDQFEEACEGFGAEEVYLDEMRNVEIDDLESGIYCIVDDMDAEANEAFLALKIYSLDLNLNADDIDSAAFMLQLDQNIDEISALEDLGDIELGGVAAFHLTLVSDDYADEIADGIEDLLDKVDVDIEDLSSSEYYSNKNGGYLKLHIDVSELILAFFDSDMYGLLRTEADSESFHQFTEQIEDMTGDISLAVYYEGENVLIVFGGSVNSDDGTFSDLCNELNVDDPSEVPSNETVIGSLMESLDDYASIITSSYGNYIDKPDDYTYYGF